jgi:hypothetical protein
MAGRVSMNSEATPIICKRCNRGLIARDVLISDGKRIPICNRCVKDISIMGVNVTMESLQKRKVKEKPKKKVT